jgi:hypothetical protein
MISRLKIAACLILIAGGTRSIISSLDISGQGDPVLPFQLQLGLSYVPLMAAIAITRSISAARWVLGLVIAQVIITFITCYLLPRRIPDELAWIPYVAVAQFLVAGFVMTSVFRYQRFINVHHVA